MIIFFFFLKKKIFFFNMGRSKRQIKHCRSIAKKRKRNNDTNEINLDETNLNDILSSDDKGSAEDEDSTEDEVEWIDDQIDNEAEQLFSVLINNMKELKPYKRPLINLGNS